MQEFIHFFKQSHACIAKHTTSGTAVRGMMELVRAVPDGCLKAAVRKGARWCAVDAVDAVDAVVAA